MKSKFGATLLASVFLLPSFGNPTERGLRIRNAFKDKASGIVVVEVEKDSSSPRSEWVTYGHDGGFFIGTPADGFLLQIPHTHCSRGPRRCTVDANISRQDVATLTFKEDGSPLYIGHFGHRHALLDKLSDKE